MHRATPAFEPLTGKDGDNGRRKYFLEEGILFSNGAIRTVSLQVGRRVLAGWAALPASLFIAPDPWITRNHRCHCRIPVRCAIQRENTPVRTGRQLFTPGGDTNVFRTYDLLPCRAIVRRIRVRASELWFPASDVLLVSGSLVLSLEIGDRYRYSVSIYR